MKKNYGLDLLRNYQIMNNIEIDNINYYINEESMSYADVLIEYKNVCGHLTIPVNGDDGFSVFKRFPSYGESNNHINKIFVYDNKVLLETNMPFCDFYSIEDCYLTYHKSENAITDSRHRFLPEIKKYNLEKERNITPFIENIDISKFSLLNTSINSLDYPKDMDYQPIIFENCMCELPKWVVEDNQYDYLGYYRLKYYCEDQPNLLLHLRVNGEMKVWENSKPIIYSEFVDKSFNMNISVHKLNPVIGVNELVFAISSSKGKTLGFCIRIERTDNSNGAFLPQIVLER